MDEELEKFFSQDICSYYITDYFNSYLDCRKEFGNITNYDYTIFSTNFINI